MQNYGQPSYDRPGSTSSFAGQQQPPVQPYQQQQQWSQQPPQQQQPSAPGYNPGTYGVMPSTYAHGSQYPPGSQPSDPYAQQPHSDVPPPPPPKPYGFAAGAQTQTEHSAQYVQNTQSAHNWQQPQQGHAGLAMQAQQGGYPVYNNAAPAPSSAPAGSYFPPSQGGRPGSMYGADQVGTTASPVYQRPGSTVMSPNEQAPAYIPPSLSGQGVQAYVPSNTNPMPGVYVPPPPDVPAWQQAQHAPLQGGNKRFTYTKPSVDPSFYAQNYQSAQPAQQQAPPLPPRFDPSGMSQQQTPQPYGQQPPQYPQTHPQQPPQPPPVHTQISQQQQHPQPPAHFGQLGQPVQPLQQQHGQPLPVPQSYMQQQAAQLKQYAQMHQQQQVQHQFQSPAQLQPQWQAPPPAQNDYTQQGHQEPPPSAYGYQQSHQDQQYSHQPQQQWQSQQQPQQLPQSAAGHQYQSVPEQGIQAPKPLDRSDTTPPDFVHQTDPQEHCVSPVASRQSSSFAPGHPTSARTDSVSSIALANLHSQRVAKQTASPKPTSLTHPTPPPPRDDASRFSALGTGGPSDWETFGTGDEIDDEAMFARKPRPVQLDSTEIPAPRQASPPSMQGWPSPASTAPIDQSGRRDTYQPTPPTATVSPVHIHRTPPPKTPQQQSFANQAIEAPQQASPQQVQKYEAPQDARHGFVMGEVLWGEPDSPRQLHSASHKAQIEDVGATSTSRQGVQVPAPIQVPVTNALAPSIETPKQKRPGATRFFSDVGTTWGLSPKDKEQGGPWGSKDDSDLSAKLQAKDAELWRLRRETKDEMEKFQAEIEASKAKFLVEIDRLKAAKGAAETLADEQSAQLNQQVETMKSAAEKAKIDADALKKENDLTIERIKEDIEGKEDRIKERDDMISNLRKQLDDLQQQLGDLQRQLGDAHEQLAEAQTQHGNAQKQLQEERTKAALEPPRPAASDLVPDLDPWYAGSLERYIDMLRGEAHEPQVENKIKTFKAFLKAESSIRGIEYYDAPVPIPTAEHPKRTQSGDEKRELSIAVPQESPDDDDFEYSPGGRPLLRRPTAPVEASTAGHAPGVTSSQSTAILTPASSVQDDSTPIQSPPEEQNQPQYKAYVPPVMSTSSPSSVAQRQAGLTNITSPIGAGQTHDEIFFGSQGSSGPRVGHKSTSSDDTGGVPVVAPLNLGTSRPVSAGPPPKSNALDTLESLLLVRLSPDQFRPPTPSSDLEDLRKEAAAIKSNAIDVDEVTKAWEKSASLTRRKNDDARRKRHEETEEHNDELFNSDEISYAELKDLEAEQKAQENKLRIQEAQDEVKSYVETVFDKVYNALQGDIAKLNDLCIVAETLLQTSVSGVKSLGGGTAPSTRACLEVLIELHEQAEESHEQIVQAIAERDKRYKKTEVQPAYNAGDKAKLKTMERHFEQAEKQAICRAKNEKAERLGDLIKSAEEAVVGAASIEQNERSRIVGAVRDLPEGEHADVLKRASETLDLLRDSSKALLALFNRLEILLNTTEVDADVAQALIDSAPESKISEMHSERMAREAQLKGELARRIGVLDQDRDEAEQLIKGKGGVVEPSSEQERERRLKVALEEAKKRNSHT